MNHLKQILSRNKAVTSGIKNFYSKIYPIPTNAAVSVRTPMLKFSNLPNSLKDGLKFEIVKKVQEAFPSSGSNDNVMGPKKRSVRKKRFDQLDHLKEGYNVIAFATAEEYDLEKLIVGLKVQDLYEPKKFFSSSDSQENEPDVLYVTAKYQVGDESRSIYFFREGTVVMWNCTDLEASNILAFLKNYEEDSYDEVIVHDESEVMNYNYNEQPIPILKNNIFYITKSEDNVFEKYTFSNALSLSVKLGIWEASLDRYVDSMAYVTEDLKRGAKIKITRAEMLKKTGELFALRHLINLSSDLLDTPDFYWDREQLETLYSHTCSYFSIPRRTKIMNEKLNHCVELADLISGHLNDNHHVRLEWMIILLIMLECVLALVGVH